MNILILVGEGITLTPDQVLGRVDGNIEVTKNSLKDGVDIAIFTCGEDLADAITWAGQIWKVGSCITFEGVSADVTFDDRADYSADIALDIENMYGATVEEADLDSLE